MAGPPPRAWFRRLVPARLRQQGPVLLVSAGVLAAVVGSLGTVRMRPTVFSTGGATAVRFAEDLAGRVALFDAGEAHTLELALSSVEYEELVSSYRDEGEKDWVEVDATVDGVAVGAVGIRLKGNSTLMSLRGGRGGPGGGGGMPPGMGSAFAGGPGAPSGFPPFGDAPPAAPPGDLAPVQAAGSAAPVVGAASSARTGGAPSMSNVSFERPSSLPLLLDFGRYLEGRTYQGLGQLAVRPVVGRGANLNEALALQLVSESGQASQRFAWVRFRVNDDETVTRLLVENPDAGYAERLGYGEGALFKSQATNAFAYEGEDPTSYVDDFTQLSAKGERDVAPIIRLLRFVHEASDEQFDAELARYVDVEALAAYVATHELLDNFDDMAGPGRNFLLWYDVVDDRFTVLTWDLNLAMGGMGGMGMGPPPGAAQGAAGPSPSAPPVGSGAPPQRGPGAGGRPGGMRGGNRLKERFLASPAFAPVREAAKQRLHALWFQSGRAAELTRELAGRVPTSPTLSAEEIAAERDALLDTVARLAAR